MTNKGKDLSTWSSDLLDQAERDGKNEHLKYQPKTKILTQNISQVTHNIMYLEEYIFLCFLFMSITYSCLSLHLSSIEYRSTNTFNQIRNIFSSNHRVYILVRMCNLKWNLLWKNHIDSLLIENFIYHTFTYILPILIFSMYIFRMLPSRVSQSVSTTRKWLNI